MRGSEPRVRESTDSPAICATSDIEPFFILRVHDLKEKLVHREAIGRVDELKPVGHAIEWFESTDEELSRVVGELVYAKPHFDKDRI
jgi:hypothetical protein